MLTLVNKNKLKHFAIDSRRQIVAFGVVLFINYPLYYVIWLNTTQTNYENLPLRVIASALCLPLIFNAYWPKKALHWLTIYWCITACYCLPFFFTFMLLKNNADALWLMNLVSATFFILLLFDVITSLTLLLVGASAGFLAFVLSGAVLHYPPGSLNPSEIIATFIPAILIGSIFARNKQVIEEIRRRSIMAEESSRSKTEFIANMSHDIRTPLAGIINFSRYLKEEEGLKEEARMELAGDIYHASEQLLKLLNGVLDVVSADTATDNDVFYQSFDLFQMLDDLIKLEKPAVKSHHLTLRQSIDKTIPRYIVSDKIKLHRILLNLIGNAIKFTEKGYIELSVKLQSKDEHSAMIIFSVKDTGIGIPVEAQEQIFERFYKVSPSYKGKYTGSGIGLHIVQKYVQLLDGKITFNSIFKKGTTFLVTLSFPIADTVDEKLEENTYKELLKQEEGDLALEEQTSHLTSMTSAVDNINSTIKILLVEDNISALKSLKLLLIPFKLHVLEAKTAEEAFELVKKEAFDLIITDIGLPGMQGDALVKKIRQLEKKVGRNRGKIVALTGHAVNREIGDVCKKAGIDEFFQKPMSPTSLETLLYPFMKKGYEKKISISEPVLIAESEEKSYPLATGKLGPDLPDTEAQLFEIEKFPLLDLKVGEEALGSEDFAKAILKDLKKDGIDPDLENLKNAHAVGDWQKVRSLAHKMKGGANVGTVRLYYAFLYMERYLKAGHREGAEALYSQMIQVIDETLNYL
ncbi:MAG: response regulator [Tatlockia sp.]|nr:response regulator [Tatlockia sp.]